MGDTQTEKEAHDYFQDNDFASGDTIEQFRIKLDQEGNVSTLNYFLNGFRYDTCPKCRATGAFKWHFMGKHNHPGCGWSWYVGPGTYTGVQIKKIFKTGMEIAVDSSDKRDGGGFFAALFGFILGVCIRLPFALCMIPIQAIVSVSQGKP